MSKVVTVQDGQTIWDMAIQEYGSVEGVFSIMEDNEGVDLKVGVKVGQRIKILRPPINKSVVEYYAQNKLKPVSGNSTGKGFNKGFSNGFN